MSNELRVGAPCILVNDEGLDIGYAAGTKGMINSIVDIEGHTYVFFMPHDTLRTYVITASRIEVIEDETSDMTEEEVNGEDSISN